MLPSEIGAMGTADYDLFIRYWRMEPWGTWRDNMHTAIIAREVRRPWTKDIPSLAIENFLLLPPDARPAVEETRSNVVNMFKSIARRRKRD